MNALEVARWLLFPVVFISAHWRLLLNPEGLIMYYPMLWTTSGKGVEDILPCHLKNLFKAHELGWYASVFSFVNIIWVISILGILVTVGPMVAMLVGPLFARIASLFVRRIVVPICQTLHRWGAFEACAYALALGFSVQGSRYPVGHGQDSAAVMVALTGGLSFVPCWMYSTSLHVKTPGGNKDLFMMVSNFCIASVLAPLALVHQSMLIGILTILAVYGAISFISEAFGLGYYVELPQ